MDKYPLAGRSKCAPCNTTLELIDLIPLINWFYLRSRCRHCGAYISCQYVIMEWATFLIFIWCLLALPQDVLWAGCLLGWSLLTLSAIDLQSYRLPDFLTLPLIIVGLVYNGLTRPELFGHFVIGAVAGYILFRAVAFLYRQFRGRDGLGRGDAKLLAAAGAWVGWQGLPIVIMLAAMSGIVVTLAWALIRGRKNTQNLPTTKIPFGPFLSLAIWITWFYGLNL
ncbi:MAG: A24 family peptidase [Emcibacter sp.]|nr:A24 family peptidase [Emcibacter sp.]